MKPHKHAELIKSWADGADIQQQTNDGFWHDICEPRWHAQNTYRIKPKSEENKEYPKTKMRLEELGNEFSHAMVGVRSFPCAFTQDTLERLKIFADVVIKRAIEDGTIPSPEAYEKCAKDLLEAHDKIQEMGIVLDNRHARDMAIARAVLFACSIRSGDPQLMKLENSELLQMICGVTP